METVEYYRMNDSYEGEDFFLKKFREKIKTGAKKLAGHVQNVTDKIGQGVKDAAKAVASAAKFVVLVPLIPVMVAALKKKGLKPSSAAKDVEATAQLFYNEIVAKKGSSYEPIDFDSFEQDEYDNLAGEIIEAIISFIKGGIKNLKDGKTSASPVMQVVQTEGAKVLAKLDQKAAAGAGGAPPKPVSKPAGQTMAQIIKTPAPVIAKVTTPAVGTTVINPNGVKVETNKTLLGQNEESGLMKFLPWIIGGVLLAAITAYLVFK
jgi:hypothetical protein